jgi:hypothetical protein
MTEDVRGLAMVLSALVWKFGDITIDGNEIETHTMKLPYADFLTFGIQTLEVFHDDENKTSYYRVRKT